MLVSQAVLPANRAIAAPAGAPEFLKQAGKFTTPDRRRALALGSVPGLDGLRPTGLGLPFDGQAMQGFSGIKAMADGSFRTLSDNGFGNKSNSTDAALMLYHVKLDWAAGTVDRLETIFLSGPDKVAPFPIVLEGADERYLTGADIESVQPVADGFWFGEDLGRYLIHVTADGKLTDAVSTVVDGKPVPSPDNPTLSLPADPAKPQPTCFDKPAGHKRVY
jgi:hypothetical protein